ncbi:BTAD domain-containing putative transcriptional regulator [Streptomyces sp. RKAG293]|uniref:AfsR/SARP family transcriptional regulator n=1 Tax=Streptomyces sp. RKAG293 TaxID=2893403 RepID=UPI0020340AF7|nr:BTAD domain-containing putative transcriptional regulator [Streptomyces sp. RKAG293]MCM2422653.1 tetratricopeptide repeat protein [Streptomyces sp. RKAG293]
MDGLRISVLGPLRAWRADRELDIGPAQQRAVLAALALRGGRVALVQELLDDIWGWDPPASAAVALRNHVSRLRTVLELDPRAPTVLVSVAGGYALRLDEAALDLSRCGRFSTDAVRAAEAGDPERAVRLLNEALALRNGTPLAGVPGKYAERERSRITEVKLILLEKRLGLELQLGRHADIAAELSALADEHPVREGLRALQMLALYRCGRQGDALAGYSKTRRFLSEELGIEPGPDLARLHQRILQSDPELAQPFEAAPTTAQGVPHEEGTPAPIWISPAQLPPDAPDFTGRHETVAHLRRILAGASSQPEMAATVCVVHGMGGVGKTTVAVHAAHAAREHFPDGQLYVDLRGASRDPANPDAVQQSFLLALGVSPRNIPADSVERTALYRSRLAGRRLLLLLDNAVNGKQVLSLLPGTAGCAALVTSRTPMACLPVTSRTGLEPFREDEALALLERIAGPERLPKEPEAARLLVRACGLLPLAVRIAASRLAARPRWTISSLVTRLSDSSRTLDELQAGGLAVEAAFELGYDSLSSAEARAFRLLAIPEIAELSPGSAAALLDTSEDAAETVLESLATAGLLESFDPGRYRYHDLLRLFARHRTVKSDPAPARKAALSRLARFYLAGMSAALRTIRPDSLLAAALDPDFPGAPRFADRAKAQEWVISELPAILGVAVQIAHHPTRAISADDARDLGRMLVLLMPFTMPFSDLYVAWGSMVSLGQVLLDEAEEDDDAPAIVNACAVLAIAHACIGQHEQARGFARRGYLTTEPDDRVFRHRLAYVRGTVAALDPDSLDEAVTHFTDAAALCQVLGEARFEAQCFLGLATTHLARKEPGLALRYSREAFTLSQAAGGALDRVLALRRLGQALHDLGRHADAVEHYTEALVVCDAHDLPNQRAHTMLGLARTHFAQGHFAEARTSSNEALPMLALLGDAAGQRLATELLQSIEAREGLVQGAH